MEKERINIVVPAQISYPLCDSWEGVDWLQSARKADNRNPSLERRGMRKMELWRDGICMARLPPRPLPVSSLAALIRCIGRKGLEDLVAPPQPLFPGGKMRAFSLGYAIHLANLLARVLVQVLAAHKRRDPLIRGIL